jgi:hypothetical protein
MIAMKAMLNSKLNKLIMKGGRAEMKMKTVLSLIAVISLVAALTPGVAFAAEDPTTGTFTCANSAPSVSAVALYTTANATTETMNPQTEYYVKVGVSDANTLDDLNTVKVWIYWDEDGTFNSANKVDPGNTQTGAIFTWTNANPDTWAIDPSASTSWALGSCIAPTLTGASGDFKFYFTPGMVAKESPDADEWHIYVEAFDGGATANSSQENLNMNWYGEIDVITTDVNWGDVDPGQVFAEDAPSENGSISVKYTANGNYSEQVAALGTWNGTGANSATLDATENVSNANQFSLRADDTDTMGSHVTVDTTSNYKTIDDAGTITAETGNTEATNSLWLKLSTTFVADTYSGTIYYQIANR